MTHAGSNQLLSQLVELEANLRPLRTGHSPVDLDLLLQAFSGTHGILEWRVRRYWRNSRIQHTRCSFALLYTASHRAMVSRLSRPLISGSAPSSIAHRS